MPDRFRSRTARRRTVFIVVGAHLLASGLLLLCAPATEIEPDPAARWRWLADHRGIWSAAWLAWMASSLSLGLFFWVWGRDLLDRGTPFRAVAAARTLCFIGIPFDLVGEVINLTAVAGAPSLEAFVTWTDRYNSLGPLFANGMYCIAGLIAQVAAWRCGAMRGLLGLGGFLMWVVGLGLSVAVLLALPELTVVFGGGVMVLFVTWASAALLRSPPETPSA